MRRNRDEHKLQVSCVKWFRLQYPKHARLIFSVPNGGKRNIREAVTLKQEGVLKGVSDIIVAIPNKQNHGLYIEFKTKTGRQSKEQKQFQKAVQSQGYRYVIIRGFETFVNIIREQFNNK